MLNAFNMEGGFPDRFMLRPPPTQSMASKLRSAAELAGPLSSAVR